MCNYLNLINNETGYVVRCKECLQLHVGFGTTVIGFSYSEFIKFLNCVNEEHDKNRGVYCKSSKVIQINTNSRSVTLIYSYNELTQLLKLLDDANKKLAAELLWQFSDN